MSTNHSKDASKRTLLKRAGCVLGPAAPVVLYYLLGLLLFFVFRLLLCWHYAERVSHVDNYWLLFVVGARMDTILLSYALLPAFLVLVLVPGGLMNKTGRLVAAYLMVLGAVSVFLEIATFPFMAEFDSRPDRLFIEHMAQAGEVFNMILHGYALELAIGLSAMVAVGWLSFRLFARTIRTCSSASLRTRAALALVFLPLLACGGRSSFGHRPANISTAAFSPSHLVNQLALNSTYSLGYAYYNMQKHEKDPAKEYGKMKKPEMFERVMKYVGSPSSTGAEQDLPLLHYQESGFARPKPLNMVIVLEESLGAEYVGCLGGEQLTPNLDRLSREGLLFTNLYSTGTRTVRGIEAIISGFLPTAGRSVVKLGLSQQNFFTIADLLKRRGYATEFIYGGNSSFDNMRSFFRGNGFEHIYDQAAFTNPVFRGTWGVSDEDLFSKANEIFSAHGEQPFFALLLTTSNHDPFEFPSGRIERSGDKSDERNDAIRYADYALGRFFAAARQAPYYAHTVFLVIADHSTRLRGEDLIPIQKFHIPGLIIAPSLKPKRCATLASQIDITPTLLDVMGISAEHPVPGRSLVRLPEGSPGRAVMQYGTTHAFMAGSRLVVHRPGTDAKQFAYTGASLVPADLDNDLAADALAHVLLPGYLYRKQLYRLPPADGAQAQDN